MNSNISFIAGRGPLPIFTGAKPHSEKFTFNLPHSTEIRKFSLLIANIFQFPAHPFLLCNNIVTYPKTFSREKRAKFCIFFTHISHQIYIRCPCQGTTDRGLEPLLTESESAVLPLHQSALFPANMFYYTSFFTKIKPFFHFFYFFVTIQS